LEQVSELEGRGKKLMVNPRTAPEKYQNANEDDQQTSSAVTNHLAQMGCGK
jgi:hypothetical protein